MDIKMYSFPLLHLQKRVSTVLYQAVNIRLNIVSNRTYLGVHPKQYSINNDKICV